MQEFTNHKNTDKISFISLQRNRNKTVQVLINFRQNSESESSFRENCLPSVKTLCHKYLYLGDVDDETHQRLIYDFGRGWSQDRWSRPPNSRGVGSSHIPFLEKSNLALEQVHTETYLGYKIGLELGKHGRLCYSQVNVYS